MPTTYNGIGTRYYGKQNTERRNGTCQHCGQNAQLTSYDTRLWFVVVFIPIIPLGRKRIVDFCSACTYHFAVELDKWETSKQLEISGSLDKFQTNPSPDAAIEVHQQLVRFQQFARAEEFQRVMQQKYSDNAKVQAYLGAMLSHLGKLDEAATFFQRALSLRPDLPEARIGVAFQEIRLGRLDEARKLLEFIESPGASQLYSLEPLERLALAYQVAGRHTEALDLFTRIQSELPKLAEIKAFRDMVKKSEKALNKEASILPKQPFSWRRFLSPAPSGGPRTGPVLTWRGLAIVGGLVALVAIGMAIGNRHIETHRTLHVVSALSQPATLEIPGIGKYTVHRSGLEIVLPEGRYRARISGPVQEEVDIEIRSTYFSRWFSDPAWVLDVGKASVLVLTQAVYSKNPKPGSTSVHFGKALHFFPKVTHPFKPLPESVRMKSHEERVYTQLDVFRGEMSDAFHYLHEKAKGSALDFAERQLSLNPHDDKLLHAYVYAARTEKQMPRVDKFLSAGLTNRPIAVEWHRLYQSLEPSAKREAQFARLYDTLLKVDPTNSALLYLRGRVTPDTRESLQWFERARTTDPNNPYPYYALGYHHLTLGNWAEAKAHLQKAVAGRPDDEGFEFQLHSARMALREYGSLEEELRRQLSQAPLDYYALVRLCDVLLAQNKATDAEQLISMFETAAQQLGKPRSYEIKNLVRRYWLYATGDFVELEKLSKGDRTQAGQNSLFYALIEQSRLAEAEQLHPLDEKVDDPAHFLTVALAWRLAGNKDQADRWLARAIAEFEKRDNDHVAAATLLKRTEPPSAAEFAGIHLQAKSKALVLMALSQKHPELSRELHSMARQFNIDRSYPYHLINRLAGQTN